MTITQRQADEFLPTGVMDASPVATGGGAGTVVYRGADLVTQTNATVHNDYVFRSTLEWGDLTVVPSDEVHVDHTDFPIIRRAGGFTGVEQIRIGNAAGKIAYSLDFSTTEGATVRSISATRVSSYYRYSESAVLELLESGGTKEAFSAGSRNMVSWWPQVTGIPYSNSNGGGRKNSPLITPRHVLGVTHYPMDVGDTITFLTADNVQVVRTVQSVVFGPAGFADLAVYLLSSSLPVTITPLPVIGSWLSYIGKSGVYDRYANQQVGIFLNQLRQAGFVDVGYYEEGLSIAATGTYGGVALSEQAPINMHFAASVEQQRLPSLDTYRGSHQTFGFGGDSGSAVLFPVASGWAVGCCMSSSWGGCFPHEEVINAMIAAVDAAAGISTGHTVTVAPDPTA